MTQAEGSRSRTRSPKARHVVGALFVPVWLLAAWGILVAAGETGTGAALPADESRTERIVGPGKVQLTFTRDGRWLDFTPSWNGNEILFSVGGLLVFASDTAGRPSVVVNTAEPGIRVSEHASRVRLSTEGVQGGFRAPSPDPDDDGDGRVNEDRLDGIDNDGDGKIDEDFAAIGDEMITTCYFAPGIEGSGARLAVHQEAYAWALPHIDGTVMVSLWIKNIGADDLDEVRIGAFFEKDGPFYFSNWLVSLPGETAAAHAGVVVCEDLQGTNVGMAVFPMNHVDGRLWTGGVLSRTDKGASALLNRLGAGARGTLEDQTFPSADSPADASVFKTRETRVDGNMVVYQVSPRIGALRSGEEVRVDLAFFAVPERTGVESAAINVFKTFFGDGINRHLPPPVSMTPRVIWGSYDPIRTEQPGASHVAIDFELLGDDPVTPAEVSFFSGIDADDIERVEVEPGVERIALGGDMIRKAVQKSEKIILKGRLESGEFFEAILKPQQSGDGVATAVVDDAELFWKTEGKLDLELLSISPNPFRDGTTIYYEVPSLIEQPDADPIENREPREVSIKVYNVAGRLVSVLVEDVLAPGAFATQWKATDDHGNPSASGVYYVRLQIGKKYLTERLILLK